MSAEEQVDAFCKAVCTSYAPLPALTMDMSVLAARLPIIRDTRHITAFHDLSAEEQGLLTDRSALARSGRCLGTLNRQLWVEITNRALSNSKDTAAKMRIVVLWCDMSHSLSPYSIKCLADTAEGLTGKHTAREIAFVKVPNANHVVSAFIPLADSKRLTRMSGTHRRAEEVRELDYRGRGMLDRVI